MGAWIEIKSRDYKQYVRLVAPRVGAWIEITWPPCMGGAERSRPAWARGLKWTGVLEHLVTDIVAPRVGAWIEMPKDCNKKTSVLVAPRVGAWIEIM